ncbi:MAG: exodeoxyribonuclease VII large subunit [Piscinibacter sp.]|uniref:exodeoxyribonuclease VII large subunit n=1 Tax=Piscinibacter sp. TaxID=1903157 RepID=UPI00258D5A57|nr:exodeoxyribonuclease VII large subunit [Piscinibacter sp.]MCW5663936.1 exodeoxyribonuclease VII large subunit [Piscinibacter sp.]
MVDPAEARSGALVWSVAGLVQAIADTLGARFAACGVRGEIASFSRAASGHCYFSLKDADGAAALIRCAMFRRAAGLLDFVPGEGQLVELRGRLAVYEPRGELQFVVESMQRAGAGALYEQFLRLQARLAAEGLFDPVRKRPIAAFPHRLGVVTSLAAAALRDVLTTLARRSPQVEVIVYPSPVQGADAPAALVQALETAGRRAEVDTLLLCRGGGSLEDLWAFNDERVVRAVAASPIPLVCGVGHETDVTLADLAADLRAPTPTAAAELAAPEAAACREQLGMLARRAQRRVRSQLDLQAQRLDTLALRLARPAEGLRRREAELVLLGTRLARAARRVLERSDDRLQQLGARLARAGGVLRRTEAQRLAALDDRLRALDPQHVLERGYAWLADTQGRVVGSVARLAPGDALEATLADGHATLQVEAIRRGRE